MYCSLAGASVRCLFLQTDWQFSRCSDSLFIQGESEIVNSTILGTTLEDLVACTACLCGATTDLRRRRLCGDTDRNSSLALPSAPCRTWLCSESGAWMVLVSLLVGTEAWERVQPGREGAWGFFLGCRWIVGASGDNLRSRASQTNKGACFRSNENMSASFTFYLASFANSVCALLTYIKLA